MDKLGIEDKGILHLLYRDYCMHAKQNLSDFGTLEYLPFSIASWWAFNLILQIADLSHLFINLSTKFAHSSKCKI